MAVDGAVVTEQPPTQQKRMRLRYAGVCRSCSAPLPAGTEAVYYRSQRQVACIGCADAAPDHLPTTAPSAARSSNPASVETGTAGASARREHRRRSAKREQRIREAHPHLGGLILALTDDPQSTRAWARGAIGEEKLAEALAPLNDRGVRLLHDRRIPGSRANIDHLAVGPASVFVIDAKRYRGRPTLHVTGGIFRPRVETLLVGRRDCTQLVTGVLKQVQLVQAALEAFGHTQVPVIGMLCFVDADWPLIGGSFITQDVRVLWPRKVADQVLQPTVLDAAAIATLYTDLARAFPTA
jgi:hypothetical protein